MATVRRINTNRDKVNATFVVHCGTDIAFVGTEKQCEKYKATEKNITRYQINSIEDYGSECYSEGSDDGYQQGYNIGNDDYV